MRLHPGDGVRLGAVADALGAPRLQGRARGRSPRSARRSGTSRRATTDARTREPDARARGGGVPAARSWSSSRRPGPSTGSSSTRPSTTTAVRALYRALGERGWLSLSWPHRGRRPRPGAGLRVPAVGRDGLRAGGAPAARVGHRRQDDHPPRHRRPARALPARTARRHDVLLARLLRAGGRLRPRRRAHAGGARRRRVRAERREALDLGRPPRRLPVGAVPHRHAREPFARAHPAHRRPPRPGSRSRRSRRSTASGSTRSASTTCSSRSRTGSARRTGRGR